VDIILPTAVLSALGLIFGLLLSYAAKKFAIDTDERVETVRALLPGANCGGCGLPSCDALATALCAGEAKPTACAVNTAENRRAIGALLGMDVADLEPSAAVVLCQGDEAHCPPRFGYDGVMTCKAVDEIASGIKGCEQACLGFGDCVRVCAFDAISIKNGIASIDPHRCTACGTCVRTCPRLVIRVLPKRHSAHVLCRTKLPPREARSICETACIKCGLCVRNCPEEAIAQDDLVVVDQLQCKAHGVCVEKCPTNAIVMNRRAQ
jgi:electron transport complex protein RnfB